MGEEGRKEVFVRKTSGLIRNLSARDAMVFNLMVMAPTAILVYGVWASMIWPGVHLPTTALICIPISLIVGLFYAVYSTTMPRSGGDYVWASRTLHPAIGFMISFCMFMIVLGVAGSYIPWFTQWALSPMLEANGYADAAALVATNEFSYVFALLFYLIVAAILSKGSKVMSYVLGIMFGLVFVGFIMYSLTMMTTGPAQFAANFNAQTGMNYQAVIDKATELGFPGKFLVDATLLGFSFTLINFLGFHTSVYLSGEVKDVRRSQLIAIAGAVIVFGLISWIAYEVTYHGMGGIFVGALSYLAASGDPSYTLPFAQPFFMPYLYRYAVSTPVYTFVLFCWSMMILAAIITYIAIAVRLTFAWSFDRVLPTALSKVDRRYGTPYMALIFVTIVAILLQIAWLWTPLLSYFAYIPLVWMIMQIITAISALAFPRVRKDIYEKSPAIARAKIGPFPVLSTLAVLAIIFGLYIAYASMQPAMIGAINPSILTFSVGLFVLGLVIYFISSLYHRKIGIPLELSFKEVPPE